MSAVFFTDRDLGKRFPEVLESAGLDVERHDDLFRDDCPDETWLQYVGENRRVAVTHDGRIRYKPNELSAVRRHRVALLVVVGKEPFPPELRRHAAADPGVPLPAPAALHRQGASTLSLGNRQAAWDAGLGLPLHAW